MGLGGFSTEIAAAGARIAVSANDEGSHPCRVCVGTFDGARVRWEATLAPKRVPRWWWPLWGSSLAMSNERVVVGGMYGVHDSSADAPLHVFERQGRGWKLASLVEDPGFWGDGQNCWGAAVAVVGDLIIASSYWMARDVDGGIRALRKKGGRWRVVSERLGGKPAGYFGDDIVANGRELAVSVGGGGSHGGLYLYELEGDSLEERLVIRGRDPPDGLWFGAGLALSDRRLAFEVSHSERGPSEVQVYAREGRGWKFHHVVVPPAGVKGESFGSGLALVRGKLLVWGDGAVWVYDEDALQPSRVLRTAPSPEQSNLGGHLVVSQESLLVSGREKVYVFPLGAL